MLKFRVSILLFTLIFFCFFGLAFTEETKSQDQTQVSSDQEDSVIPVFEERKEVSFYKQIESLNFEDIQLNLTDLQKSLLQVIEEERKYKYIAIDKEIAVRYKIISEELSKQDNIEFYLIEKVFDEIKLLAIDKEKINLNIEKKIRYILGALEYAKYKILSQKQIVVDNQNSDKPIQ